VRVEEWLSSLAWAIDLLSDSNVDGNIVHGMQAEFSKTLAKLNGSNTNLLDYCNISPSQWRIYRKTLKFDVFQCRAIVEKNKQNYRDEYETYLETDEYTLRSLLENLPDVLSKLASRSEEKSLQALMQPIEICLEKKKTWLPAFKHLQEIVLNEMLTKRIAIEVNISSNTQISGENPHDHPLFRWYPPSVVNNRDHAKAFVTLGTDDPGIFCTELHMEYAYAARLAEELGYHAMTVGTWLEELQRMSHEFCFVSRLPGRVNSKET
jgi:hypothetical protein